MKCVKDKSKLEFINDFTETEDLYFCPSCKTEYIYDRATKELFPQIKEG